MAAVTTALAIAAALAGPVYSKTIIYQTTVVAPTQPQANDGVGWHRPFSEPTRRVVARQQGWLASVPFTEHQDVARWFRPFSLPRAAKRVAEFPAFTSPPLYGAITGDSSAVAFTVATSLRYSKTIIFEDYASVPRVTPAAPGVGVGLDQPWPPFSVPRAAKRVPEFPALAYLQVPSETPPVGGTPGDAANLVVGAPRSGPTFTKTVLYQTTTNVSPSPLPSTEAVAFGAYASSRQVSRTWRIYQDVAYTTFIPFVAEIVTSDKWFAPFSQPTRRKTFREGYVARNPALIVDEGIQAKWFQPFGLPRAAERAPEFPAFIWSPYFVPAIPGSGAEYNWWANLSERIRVRSPVTQQQSVIQGPRQPLAVTLEYAWQRPLSEPVRLKRITGQGGTTFYQGDFSAEFAWRPPLARPTLRPPLTARPAFPYVYVPPRGVGVGLDQPWPPLSQPTRRIVANQKQVLTIPPTAIDFFGAIGGPADESERVICVPESSREASVPYYARIVYVPEASRSVNSNGFRDRLCGQPPSQLVPPPAEEEELIVFQDDVFDPDVFE